MSTCRTSPKPFKTFASLAELSDASIQMLVRGLPGGMLDLALLGAPKKAQQAFLRNVTARRAQQLRHSMKKSSSALLAPARTCRKEILAATNRFLAEGKIVRAKDRAPARASSPDTSKANLKACLSTKPCALRDAREMKEVFQHMATVARRNGILALEPFLRELDPLTRMGMQEVLDGMEPEFLATLIASRKRQQLAELELRLDLVRMAVLTIQRGKSPEMIRVWCEEMIV